MNGSKKFGTFSGVFTPSILTILGVIMYMRLPWIVGQAGLWMTIGIVLVAHVIAITTGLSVSSIATDKKVKAGGSYYMISRSLGLPIGGTLGIALFVGMSFSISLYLIGFSESFLSYWKIESSPNNIRLTGSITLLIVAIITVISTSLAMKTQFFIMGAIVLSLFTILFGQTPSTNLQPHLSPMQNAVPFAVLFSIFFPAVTGFEAGVSMSGDLKDPKKSIPIGTMMAIAVGLIAYIGLSVFFAYRVDAKQLVENSDILIDISFYSPLLVAGIWGATISSSIGSILGAPRILQATSTDNITPKIFGKGYGKTNEPRNALVLTFLIAEGGILIGELDIIARIVSMFYITAYGFLNISCTFESWVSPDFRPEFKIPWWVGLLGAVICLVIMIQLDFIAMIGSTILMSLLFLFIKKRELKLEGGDVWEGFWSSIVVRGLHKLSKTSIHERNWKPNIVLFSDIEESPYLLQLAHSLTVRNGIITNFELEENQNSTFDQYRSSSILSKEMIETERVFTRNLECKDVYDSMNQIARYYGFSGVEPNTVILGRAKNIKNAEKFAHLVQNLERMDYNLLMLDYNHTNGFGKYKKVDIWWSGYGKNMTLALSLVRFLQSSEDWRDANYRFLIITEDSSIVQFIRRQINLTISNFRILAEVKVIYNGVDNKSFFEIIRQESRDSDLTFLGMPDYRREDAISIAKKINQFSENLNSILWIKASSYFQELDIQTKETKTKAISKINQTGNIELKLPENVFISKPLEEVHNKLEQILIPFYENYISSIFQNQLNLLNGFLKLVEKGFTNIKRESKNSSTYTNQKLLTRIHGDFLYHAYNLVNNYKEHSSQTDVELVKDGVKIIFQELKTLVKGLPSKLSITKEKANFAKSKFDSKSIKRVKFWRRMTNLFSKDFITYEVPFQRLLQYYLGHSLFLEIKKLVNTITNSGHNFMLETHKISNVVSLSFVSLYNSIENNQFDQEFLENEKIKVLSFIQNKLQIYQAIDELNKFEISKCIIEILNNLSKDLDRIDAKEFIYKNRKIKKSQEKIYSSIDSNLQSFEHNYSCFLDMMQSGVLLFSIKNRFKTIVYKTLNEFKIDIRNGVTNDLLNFIDLLNAYKNGKLTFEKLKNEKNLSFEFSFQERKVVLDLFQELKPAIESVPENIDIINDESLQKFENGEFHEAEIITVNLRRYIEYSVENDFFSTLLKEFSKLPKILYEVNVVTKGILSSIQFGVENMEENFEEQFLKNVDNDIINLQTVLSSIESYIKELNKNIVESLDLVLEKFDIFYFVRISDSLGKYIKTVERQKYFTGIKKNIEALKTFYYDGLVKLMYGKSEAILLARNFQSSSFSDQHKIETILNTIELLSPKKQVLNNLPFYYKTLFLGKTPFSKELWVGRKEELNIAAKSINYYLNGYNGALILTGEKESGKSWLSRFIAERYFDLDNIYSIFPPNSYCTTHQELEDLLSKELKINGNMEKIFQALPSQSVLIFHDLELFWTRKIGGTMLIEQILNMVEKYSNKILFIFNMNKYAYNLLNKIIHLENYLIGHIECSPFDAEELKDMLLIRHRTTGYKLEINGSSEENISKLNYAKYFNKFFNYSDGMPGTALRGWIRSIENISKNTISIKAPPAIDINNLNSIPTEWYPYLIALILHKKLSIERFTQVTLETKEEFAKVLHTMKRTGVISEDEQGVFEINGFLYHHLIYNLNQKGIL